MSASAPPEPHHQAGFTLLELAIVLVIIGLVAVFGSQIAVGVAGVERRKDSAARLDTAETALSLFVSQNRRLPCPADGSLAAGAANYGREQRQGGGNCVVLAMQRGVVPWVTLGLPEPASLDGWGRRISYRVFDAAANGFTRDNGLDMTACDPAATDETPTADCSTALSPKGFMDTKGLRISDAAAAGTVIMEPNETNPWATPGGAAYVLVSHGENGLAGYTPQGTLLAGAPPANEAPNRNGIGITGNNPTGAASGFVDRPWDDSGGAGQFDDMVRRPGILAVATKAGLGPRAP